MRVPDGPYGSATKRSPVRPGRPRYPRASWTPERYSSPATPGGTGRSAASSTYVRVFHTGRPIGTATAPGSTRTEVTSTDASVGPYRLCSSAGSTAWNREARSAGSASPLHITRHSPMHSAAPGSSRNARSIEGTKCTVVTRSSWISPARYAGSLWPSGLATTSAAPVIRGQKNSHTDTSKLDGVFCSTRSEAVRPYSSCIHSRRLTMPSCGTTTPFGLPVDPEV